MRFTIPIHAVAKARPRLGRGGHVFTPQKTRRFEQEFMLLARQFLPDFPLAGPLSVSMKFFIEKPRTVKREYPTTKPDLDNYVKAVLDAMNGHFYDDDAMIVDLHAMKLYSCDPRIEISIASIESSKLI